MKLGIRVDDFEEGEIEKIEDEIEGNNDEKENEEEEDNEESFNINNQPRNMIILYYYHQFINKKQIPPKSLDTIKVINFLLWKIGKSMSI